MVAYPGPVRTADTAFTTGIAASIGACYFAIDTAAICNTQHPSRTADVRPFSFSII
jgi:hypothetical protein